MIEAPWREQPFTVGQVIERVQQSIDWHENTIKTLLTRLVKKKAVARHAVAERESTAAMAEESA